MGKLKHKQEAPELGLTDSLFSSEQGPFCPTMTGGDRKDPPCLASAQEGKETAGVWLYSHKMLLKDGH